MKLGNKFIEVEIDGELEQESTIYDNLFPLIILFHLLRYPSTDKNNSYDSHVELIKLVGSFEGLLYPLYRIANHSNEFHMHDIGKKVVLYATKWE
ncbi:hypothetical protein [Clostridium beijerinckii]|uniref:Uncharacterized protein n=1 Tax=Clostridium beijerinckii TaxID=1520 RepID=A0A1S8SCR4_CLOBE|nr:hypothetical protein [Clostridium beijerinckii]NRY61676.1 hypothetical protein [Clostridium beijerinckii]OOM63288.1 hypothetical protein CLBCK_11040 [Clostridium beijerinckii]